MNRAHTHAPAMVRGLVLALVLALLLALTGCTGDDAQAKADPLHASRVDPPFAVSTDELTDVDGDPYSLAGSTKKRLTLVFFGYTHCPDICPAVMSNLASAMTRLDDADRKQVDVVFVTTDPDRDTAQVLGNYLDNYDSSFIGVTGPIEEIVAVGRSIAVGMGEPLADGTGYEVDAHTTQVTAIDSADEAPLFWGSTTSSAEYAQDIHTLLGDS